MENVTDDINSIRKVAEHLALSFTDQIENFTSLFDGSDDEVTSEIWKELPKEQTLHPIFAAVDGGSRMLSTRGAHILFAQAAGRPMGGKYVNVPWIVERYAAHSKSEIANDLLGQIRQRLELAVATRIIQDYSPDYLLLDGTLDSIFRIGIPSSISVALGDDRDKDQKLENLDPELQQFYRELLGYVAVLHEFFDSLAKSQTTVLAVPKDTRSTYFVPSKYDTIGDASYFSIISDGKPGYSRPVEIDAEEKIFKFSAMESLWEIAKLPIPLEFTRITRTYTILSQNSIPVCIDQFTSRKKNMNKIISDLLTVYDGKGWFIPPRLAHEKAVVKQDVFDALYKIVYAEVSKNNPVFAKVILGKSRRSITQ